MGKNGKWYVWDDNRILRVDMTFLDGKKEGTCYIYGADGKLKENNDYDEKQVE